MTPELIPFGKCPRCGIVYGDEVEYNFPAPAECECGMELETCTTARKEEIENHES